MATRKKRRKRAINLSKPLSTRLTPSGVLSIDIGMETLAFAAISMQTTYRRINSTWQDPHSVFTITNKRGFAKEVVSAMSEEREDGSSLLTDLLDAAAQKAIDDGSQYFWKKTELAEERQAMRKERRERR